ncbi:hypothetical protein [Propionimicrobium sp. PCR01-08-3]|nr:hypothetical protein [Propionimicrobium sp. PCR01-08-3]WIY82358.1 hypothetical protein QQ658_12755 [Propionimicrobium sp. PCR01-08-3]
MNGAPDQARRDVGAFGHPAFVGHGFTSALKLVQQAIMTTVLGIA